MEFTVPTWSLGFATAAALILSRAQTMLRAARLKSTFVALLASSPNNMLMVFYASKRCLIGSFIAC
jgi:hypothetical protein